MLSSDQHQEKLKLSQDEIKRFDEALKDDEFRRLLVEYMHEISDPANRKLYEEEIAKLEAERGNDIRWLKPTPCFVVKTSFTSDNGSTKKLFINICSSSEIEQPTASPKFDGGREGQQWSLPYSLTQLRDDIDKSGNACSVCDCIYNPKTCDLASSSSQFKDFLTQTSLENVSKQLLLKLSPQFSYPKMKSKGTPASTVLRSKLSNGPVEETSLSFIESRLKSHSSKQPLIQEIQKTSSPQSVKKVVEPKYKVVERGQLDMQNFVNERFQSNSQRPKELVITIDLPGIDEIESAELDIDEKSLSLLVHDKYQLFLNLSYPVNHEKGSAVFEKVNHKLKITLPVLPSKQSVVIPESDVTITHDDSFDEDIEEVKSVAKVENHNDVTKTPVEEAMATCPVSKVNLLENLSLHADAYELEENFE